MRDLAALWTSCLADARVSTEQPPMPGREVRPSSFPFCSRRYGFARLVAAEPDDWTVRSDTYTAIGTAVHEVIQAALGRHGLVDVDREVRDDGIGLVGHIDGVLDGVLIEIKTTSAAKVAKLRRMSTEVRELAFLQDSPWTGYRDQALTYAALLGLDGAVIFVVSRDDPSKCIAIELSGAKAHYASIRDRIANAQALVGKRMLPIAEDGPACTYCPRRDVCDAPDLPPDVTDAQAWE